MTEPMAAPADLGQRQRALDITGSFIVQAPAGSGKTELLIQRILALLAATDNPEEILAITFTRKAAVEMRKRLLEALESASCDVPPEPEHAAQTWSLARAALHRDEIRGWKLLVNSSRLQVMTIDSFGAALVRRMPWLARFGDVPAITDEPLDLYRAAAERLLGRLERGGAGGAAIERLLAHLDNRVPLLRDLLVAMLARRDQWLRHLDLANLATTRPDLESALCHQVVTALAALRGSLDDDLLARLSALGAWAAGQLAAVAGDNPLAPLLARSALPSATIDDLPVWVALAHLALTGDGQVRQTADRRLGFPPGKESPAPEMKAQLRETLDRLRVRPDAVQSFQELRHLPATTYTDSQWEVLAALLELLPLADVELRETFREEGRVDFAEVSRGALAALGDDLAPGDLLLHLDSRLRHILVDEFQDTSRGQFELLSRLTAGWERDDGRTLFVVGDPMQSIYRFREAEVGLYLRVRARGLENIRLTPLVLTANFRSQSGLVDWFNATFAQLFPVVEDEMRGAVPFSPAQPVRATLKMPALTLTCFEKREDVAEAVRIVAAIRQAQADNPEGTVAVLVRSRAHLATLLTALRAAGVPWQAQEIDSLTRSAVICDLMALTRAVLHPADRVAWLAVLRAPWCGLCLNDLLALCGGQPEATIWECLTGHAGQLQLFSLLSAEGQLRIEPIVRVLSRAMAGKGRVSLRRLIETAWLGLYGPAGLAESDLTDAGQYFLLLEELDEGGDVVRLEALEERVGKLFAAPDSQASPKLQLMTIHKAKGLEFDTVILPGLGRTVRPPDRPLLLWQEQLDPERWRAGLLLAPIPASTTDDQDPTYQAIARIHAEKDRLETLRQFYVAATRARQHLHLFGHAKRNQDGVLVPAGGSLLKAVWPALSAAGVAGEVAAPEGSEVMTRSGIMLRRRPTGWTAPAPAFSLPSTVPDTLRVSVAGHREGYFPSLSLRTEEGRIIGTAVHGWLERIAFDGPANWSAERLTDIRSALRDEMMANGVPRVQVSACVERAVMAIGNTLCSPRGRWILAWHPEACCELALTGAVDGMPIHAIIDRTFVDEAGVRWIIDYKTSCPEEGEAVETFLSCELARYRPQLEDYRKLLIQQKPPEQIKAALYFPLLDAWCEVA